MKKLLAICLFTASAFGQSNSVYNATTYSYTTQVTQGNTSTGSSSLRAVPTAFAQGIPFSPYNTNASITLNRGASDSETVALSTVANCYPNSLTCTLSGTFTFKHIAGENIQSGTYGLQEAVNMAMAAGSGTVLIDATWQGPTGSSLITAAKGNNNVMIQDNRNPSGALFYQWNGSAYAQSGGGSSQGTNAPLNIVPVEQFGAIADYPGPGSGTGVGTDSTTALQNCINYLQTTVGSGQCLLKPGNYRITSTIHISKSGIGFAGSSYGAGSINTSNQLIANAPISAIYIDSATADAIDVSGADISHPVSFNRFNDFTIMRTVADTGAGTGCKNGAGTSVGAAGLSIQYAGGWTLERVWSEDSACLIYLQNAGAYGTGYIDNFGGLWGANGFNPIVSVYGVLMNGANSAESLRIRNSFVQTLYPGYSGVQSIGFLAAGPQLNDIMLDGFETAFVTYGEFFLSQGSPASYSSSDIHLNRTINDSFFQNGVVVDGLTAATGGSVEINGGWNTTFSAGSGSNSAGVYILNSSGVLVSNVEFGQNGSQAYGVLASGSSNISINGNHFLNQGTAAIALGTTSNATVTGNVIHSVSGSATPNFIAGTSLTYSSIIGNSIGGFCSTAGISLDSSSNNNVLQNAIDPTNCAVPIVNNGSNNQLSASTTWPPSASGPTFSPTAGAVGSGTTVTTSCSGGSPFISTGSTAVAGATGIAVSSAETLYGSCQGSGYFTTGSSAYTISGSLPTAIHRWPMNEASGSTLHDTIGTTNLTASNVTWSVTTGLGATAVAQFNGTSSSAVAAAVDSTLNFNGTQPMTIAFWVNPVAVGSGSFAGNLQTSSSFQGWEASFSSSGTNALLVVGAVTSNQMTATSTTADITTGSGQCVVDTYTGSLNLAGVKEYVNGTAQTLTDTSGTLTSGSTSTQPFNVGARNGTNFYHGALAYMYVWNQVLTPSQAATFCSNGPQ